MEVRSRYLFWMLSSAVGCAGGDRNRDASGSGDSADEAGVAMCAAGSTTLDGVYVVPSMERVAPDSPAGTATSIALRAARGEYESLQVVVKAPAGGVSGASVVASDLVGPGGAKIPAANVRLFREHYVSVAPASPDWGGSNRPGGAGTYADGLIPFTDPDTGEELAGATLDASPFTVAAAASQPIWVDIEVPRDAVAGEYRGTLEVDSDQGNACVEVAVHVWDFELPVVPSLKSSFLVWSSNNRATYEELLRNRVAPSAVTPADERALIDELGLGSTGLGLWSGADIGNCSMQPAPSVATIEARKAEHAADLFLYDYSADEVGNCPNLYPTLKAWGRNLHDAGVANLVTMMPVAALFDDGSGTGRSAVDVWVVLPVMYTSDPGSVGEAIGKGDEVWSYNTLVQDAYSPKWTIDFTPIDFRIQPGFLNQALGLSGLLYWRVDRWSSDPWNDVNNAGEFSSSNYPGEGALVYPGDDVGIAGVAPSMRLKWLRDGVDDYEYIAILRAADRQDEALDIVRAAATDWKVWTRDASVVEDVRKQLGDLIASSPGG